MLHRWGWSALVALSLLSVAAVARGGQLDEVIAAENKSAGLKLEAMPIVSDEVFLRRVYVDLIGRIPTAAEVTEFAAANPEDRREKLERIREAGIEPFPHEFSGREDIAEVRAAHPGLQAGAETDSRHRVAGRIVARRGHGKACFLDVRDGSDQIQLHARKDVLGDEAYEMLVDLEGVVGIAAVPARRRLWARRGAGESCRWRSTTGACWPRACGRRRTSSTGSRTPRPASAAASST